MTHDDDVIKAIDQEMGWVGKDGSSPSKTARDLGMRCKFLPGGAVAWLGPGGTWSVCVLSGVRTTLLARSFGGLLRLYTKARERRAAPRRWRRHYSAMWERRYRRWVCARNDRCECQLHRIERAAQSSA